MDAFLADLRYACRNILRRPGFSALAVLTLAVGIGVNTVAFTAVNALLFHPFVFKGVERLGWIMLATPGNPDGELSYSEFGAIQSSGHAFDAVAAQGRRPLALIRDGRAEQIWSLMVTNDFFRAIDARAEQGRLFEPQDVNGGDLVAVVSHEFWHDHLRRDSIDNATLTIAGRTVYVVGILPEGFRGPSGLFAPDVWVPLERAAAFGAPPQLLTGNERWLGCIARLRDGATAAQASAELSAIAAHLPADTSHTGPRDQRLGYFPMRDGHPEIRSIARFVWVAMAVVGIVFVIACFNVAALLLARATERQREIGIRTAIGAGRRRIVQQLVTEGLVLAAISGVAALVVAAWSGKLLAVFSLPAPIPQRLDLAVDRRIFTFTALMVLAGGVLPALLPALQATRNLTSSMRLDAAASGGRRSRTRNLFVAAQITGSTLFLATALLFVRSFWNAARADVGFTTDRVVVARLDPAAYGLDGARAASFAQQLADRVDATPGVTVAVADRVPFAIGYPRRVTVSTRSVDCSVTACQGVVSYRVGRRHFEALGIPIRAGREFTDRDIATADAVIVNDALAAALWPGRPAVGETVRLAGRATPVTVVGVVGNIAFGNIERTATPLLYEPIQPSDFATGFSLIARTSAGERLAADAIRNAMRDLAPTVPIAALSTMNELMSLPLWPRRTLAGFFLICGALSLTLATVGLFGVTYFTVRQRTREFGVRIALGARAADVVRQVLGEGARVALPSAVAGLALAALAGRLLSRMLLGVTPLDPLSFGATAVIETAVALLACAVPAFRATQSDPMVALRSE